MIDIAVGALQTPGFRVFLKIGAHIEMHRHLQVDIQSTQRTDQHIGTNASFNWHIAARIGQPTIAAVIAGGDTDLCGGSGSQ